MSLRLGHLIAAVFLTTGTNEHSITHLGQILYLVDRESIAESGRSLFNGDLVYTSMGPCHEKMYSLAIGDASCFRYGWSAFLEESEVGTLLLKDPNLRLEDLHELDEDDIRLVRKVASRGMSENELSFWMCDVNNLPELVGLPVSAHPVEIPLESIVEAAGRRAGMRGSSTYNDLLRTPGRSMAESRDDSVPA